MRSARGARWLPTLGAFALALAAPADVCALDALPDEDTVVAIHGFELRSLGSLEAGSNRIDLHPKALLGAVWESNPNADPPGRERADTGLRATVGLELRSWIGDRTLLGLDGAIDTTHYGHTPARSFTGGEAGFGTRTTGEDWTVETRAHWRRDDEPMSPLPEQVRRDRLEASLATDFESRAWRSQLKITFARLDYLADGPYFGADERDTDTTSLAMGIHRLGGRGSMLGAIADAAAIDRGAEGDAWQAGLQAHWLHPLGERASLDLRAGAALRGYTTPSGGLAANDDRSVMTAVGRLGFSWSWESGSWLLARAERSLQDGTSGRANASVQDAAVVEARLRLRDRLGGRVSLWASQREDSASPDGSDPLRVRSLMVRAGPEYQLREGLGIRAWAMYLASAPSVGSDSASWTAAIEMGLVL